MSVKHGSPRAGVIGYPISHSKSPRIHGEWLKRYGIQGEYTAIEVKPEDLETFLRNASRKGFVGVNVTIPHKEAALALADEVTPLARRIGAANTITFQGDRILADNTDAFGFIENLKASAPNWSAAAGPAVVLGAGGAARAIVAALVDAGAPEIRLANRTRFRAERLAAEIGGPVTVIDWPVAAEAMADAATIVNTTSLGMTGQPPLEVDLSKAPQSALATDIVYAPLITPFLEKARAHGLKIVDGFGMLLHQARPGFERWFGRAPEVDDALRRIVLGEGARRFLVLGLTGSIGMGKSTTKQMFEEAGAAVWCADDAVARLYGPRGRGALAIAQLAPKAVGPNGVDRTILRGLALSDPDLLKKIEKAIHPMVQEDRRAFLARAEAAGAKVAICDIPLLFETGAESEFDAVVVVTAPAEVQRKRVLARPGMTDEALEAILARQLPDAEKRARANYVIDTGYGLDAARAQVAAIMAAAEQGEES